MKEKKGKNTPPKKPFDLDAYRQQMQPYVQGAHREKLFWHALDFAANAHAGVWRKSGDAYILHPCSVALVLVEELDVCEPEILAAALLHDTVEDVKEVTFENLRREFGTHVAAIVDGCTKVSHYSGNKQNFKKMVHRKIFSGAAGKLEVVLVKLADRIHNLRTLGAMPTHKRQRIAAETLDVYAPIATLLGLFSLKRVLYNQALEHKFPKQSNRLKTTIRNLKNNPETKAVVSTLNHALLESGSGATVRQYTKGLWAYYDIKNRILIKEIDNAQEIQVSSPDRTTCYQALGILNKLYPPIPRTIRDFIANPKPTGYQAIHARANINGRKYLFKIRTRNMARRAQRGMAADWGGRGKKRSRFERELQEMFEIIGKDPGVDFRDVIIAKGRKELYTYTPGGDLICLPINSTVLDFAFQIHTDVGHTCTGAVVNQTEVLPAHCLCDGDVVNILRQELPVHFAQEKQQLCQTAKARHELAKAERQRRKLVTKRIGRSVLEQELRHYGVPHSILEKEGVTDLLDYFDIDSIDELYSQVGMGTIRLRELILEIRDCLHNEQNVQASPTGRFNMIFLRTLDPVGVKLSACCRPNPVDKGLIGLLSERGLSLHHVSCSQLAKIELQREDAVEVHWRLRETRVRKSQVLFFPGLGRKRLFTSLGNAPKEMEIVDVQLLSDKSGTTPPWQVDFKVANLYELKKVLRYLRHMSLRYEFELEQ